MQVPQLCICDDSAAISLGSRISIAGLLAVECFLDSVFLDPVGECVWADVQITCRVRLIPIAYLKGLENKLLLDRVQADALTRQTDFESLDRCFLLSQEWRQVFDRYVVSSRLDNLSDVKLDRVRPARVPHPLRRAGSHRA